MALFLYGFWAITWLFWVLLVLAPASVSTPEWLLAARQYCFGTLPQQLPTPQGWLLLTAPIPMLLTLLAFCGKDLRQQFKRLPQVVSAFLIALPFFTVGYAGFRVAQQWDTLPQDPMADLPLSPDYPVTSLELPNFILTDQDGRQITRESFKGQITLLTFAYAHCETACPMLLETLRGIDTYPRVVVTLDPWRDTCGSLTGIAKTWGLGNTQLLSGDPTEVEKLTNALSIPIQRDEKTGEIFHPSLIYVLDKEGRIAYSFTSPPVDWLKEAAQRAETR